MENGLEAELDDQLGYNRYDYKNKNTDNSRNGHSSKTLRTSFGDIDGLLYNLFFDAGRILSVIRLTVVSETSTP